MNKPIDRRSLLASSVAGSAAACLPGTATAAAIHDPLLEAIRDYHASIAAIDAWIADEKACGRGFNDDAFDEAVERLIDPAWDKLKSGAASATTLDGVRETLRFAVAQIQEEGADDCIYFGVICSALAFFDGDGRA